MLYWPLTLIYVAKMIFGGILGLKIGNSMPKSWKICFLKFPNPFYISSWVICFKQVINQYLEIILKEDTSESVFFHVMPNMVIWAHTKPKWQMGWKFCIFFPEYDFPLYCTLKMIYGIIYIKLLIFTHFAILCDKVLLLILNRVVGNFAENYFPFWPLEPQESFFDPNLLIL